MSIPSAYLGVILIWATTPLAIKWSGEEGDFLFAVALRMVIGLLLCLLLVVVFRERPPMHRRAVTSYFIAGGGIFGSMVMVYWAATWLPSGLISVLFGLTPLAIGLLSALWLAERGWGAGQIIGVLLGIAGLAILFGLDNGSGGPEPLGIIAIIVAVVIHSVSSVALKHYAGELSPLALNLGALSTATPLFILAWLLFGESVSGAWPSPRPLAAIVYLGVLGSAIGFNLYFYILRHCSASSVSLITLITPVVALWLGNVLNGEALTGHEWLGSGGVLLGLLSYQWRSLWRRRAPRC